VQQARAQAGMTLVEVMIVGALIGVMVGVGAFASRNWWSNETVRAASRQVADLLLMGRSESIRTATNHIAYFNLDPNDNPLVLADGTRVPALLIADLNGNGLPDAGEQRGFVPFADQNAGLFFGRSVASTLVPNTGAGGRVLIGDPFDETPVEGTSVETDSAGNFRHPTNAALVNSWVLLSPNGTPRSVIPVAGVATTGPMGSGDGAVYISNGTRDYAVVLAPLGGVRTYSWDKTTASWR